MRTVLVGGEVAVYTRFEGFGYLLLARPCDVGESLCFCIVRNEDGLGYGRRHVALEEDARGERVRRPRGDLTCAACRGQGRERSEHGVGQFLVLAPLAEEGGRVVGGCVRGA